MLEEQRLRIRGAAKSQPAFHGSTTTHPLRLLRTGSQAGPILRPVLRRHIASLACNE